MEFFELTCSVVKFVQQFVRIQSGTQVHRYVSCYCCTKWILTKKKVWSIRSPSPSWHVTSMSSHSIDLRGCFRHVLEMLHESSWNPSIVGVWWCQVYKITKIVWGKSSCKCFATRWKWSQVNSQPSSLGGSMPTPWTWLHVVIFQYLFLKFRYIL